MKAAHGLEPSWLKRLRLELEAPYMKVLQTFLTEEARRQTLYPPVSERFNAFTLTPFEQVRVVILGQDPYHGPGQANGLCFSVAQGVRPPPSLMNIFRELGSDLGAPMPAHGDLTPWARQGVLLLNTVLSVAAKQANSHRGRGWEQFTDAVIDVLNRERAGLVFLLWGAAAAKKTAMIDATRNLILKAPHPSPLSAYRGFLGCRHFSQVNAHLRARGQAPIDWAINS